MIITTAHIRHAGGLDVSRKTGDLTFAPSWSILTPVLNFRRQGQETEATWQTYAQAYTDEMRTSLRANRARWEEVLHMDKVCFKCYCARNILPRCHRVLLVEMFVRIGKKRNVSVVYLGEVS